MIPSFVRNIQGELLINETIQKDGTCFETFERINVFAKK
jgi:hypothetical protein